MLAGFVGHLKRRCKVDGHHFIPLFPGKLCHVFIIDADTGTVHQDVIREN